jgi:hypothetical protein
MGDFFALQAHADGLRQILELRGGFETTAWCDVTNPAIKGWDVFCTNRAMSLTDTQHACHVGIPALELNDRADNYHCF